MYRSSLVVPTRQKGLIDITDEVNRHIVKSGHRDGMVNLFLHHTSASLLVNEGADPRVAGDLERWLSRLVMDGDSIFEHREEGPDDMSAHVRLALTAVSISMPVMRESVALGTWQRIFLWEHRHGPMERRLTLTVWN